MKKVFTLVIALALIICTMASVFAAHPVPATEQWLENWAERETASGKIWQAPGEKENDRVFSWLSKNMKNTFSVCHINRL